MSQVARHSGKLYTETKNTCLVAMKLWSLSTTMIAMRHSDHGNTILLNGVPLQEYAKESIYNFLQWKGYVFGRGGRTKKTIHDTFFNWFYRRDPPSDEIERGVPATTRHVRAMWKLEKEIDEVMERKEAGKGKEIKINTTDQATESDVSSGSDFLSTVPTSASRKLDVKNNEKGIINHGINCWLNTALQVAVATCGEKLQDSGILDANFGRRDVHKEIKTAFRAMILNKKNQYDPGALLKFVQGDDSTGWRFFPGQHMDPVDGYLYLLQKLDKIFMDTEGDREREKPFISSLLKAAQNTVDLCREEKESLDKIREDSDNMSATIQPLRHLFFHSYSCLKCNKCYRLFSWGSLVHLNLKTEEETRRAPEKL